MQIEERYSGQYTVGQGNVQAIGSTAAWMLRTAAQICALPGFHQGDDKLIRAFEDLGIRCLFGVPTDVVAIAELRVLRRSEVIQLVANAKDRRFTSLHQILDAPASDFVGILSPQRAERLKAAILDSIGESLGRRRAGHLARADKLPVLRPLIERVYDCHGDDLDAALDDLFNAEPFLLKARRFTRQRTGQPDLEIQGPKGTVVIQATASLDGQKPINWAKAREVTASIGYSGKACNFVTLGRPEFHDVAIGNAKEIADRGDLNLLLMPLPELIELCLREAEGAIPPSTLLDVLQSARGHYVGD